MVTPFLNFAGKAGEAIDFYERVFHGQGKHVMRYKDAPPNPDFPVSDAMKDYVMHAEMTINGTKMSFSDTQDSVTHGSMISLAVDFPEEDKVREVYNSLKEGGEVLMELAPQFFSPLYGWVVDRYGISWQIICSK